MDVRKDVSAVCSLSYHLPRDAVAFGAMRPVFLDDDGGDGEGDGARKSAPDGDERPIEMSFRGTIRGGVRERILGHYLSGAVDVEKMRWDLRSNGQVSPREYMSLMRCRALAMELSDLDAAVFNYYEDTSGDGATMKSCQVGKYPFKQGEGYYGTGHNPAEGLLERYDSVADHVGED